jgi:hypothetical protein
MTHKEMVEKYGEEGAAAKQQGSVLPPTVRSVLQLCANSLSMWSWKFRSTPGFHCGLMFKGNPSGFANGYRCSTEPMNMDNENNFLRLKDPLLAGRLSVPIFSMLLLQLSDDKVLDLNKPLTEYLPELSPKFERLTAAAILSGHATLDEAAVLRDVGAKPWRALAHRNQCEAAHEYVHHPITNFFSLHRNEISSAVEQRRNFVEYLRTAKMSKPLLRPQRSMRPSHFSIALIAAAIDAQVKGTFEEQMRVKIFEPIDCHPCGFGVPALYRNPNEMFYKDPGHSLQHSTFYKPIPFGAPKNAGPLLFNASMNMYGPVEEMTRLLLFAFKTIDEAKKKLNLPCPSSPHLVFGALYKPSVQRYEVSSHPLDALDILPSVGCARYDVIPQNGVYCVSNCGAFQSRVFTKLAPIFCTATVKRYILKHNHDPYQQLQEDMKKEDPDPVLDMIQNQDKSLGGEYKPSSSHTKW